MIPVGTLPQINSAGQLGQLNAESAILKSPPRIRMKISRNLSSKLFRAFGLKSRG